MTDLDVALTPAQWEHWDRHGWTLAAAPTEPCPSTIVSAHYAYMGSERVNCTVCEGRAVVPVPATVPCPGGWDLLQGPSNFPKRVHHDLAGKPCPTCKGSGVVPRVVGIIPPEWCGDSGPFPAERVGTAAVAPVPVVHLSSNSFGDVRALAREHGEVRFLVERDGKRLWLIDHDKAHDVTHLFPTPPEPGTTVWRLDRNEER